MKTLYFLAAISIPLTLLAIGFYGFYGWNKIPTPLENLQQLFYPLIIGFLYIWIIIKAFKLKKENPKASLELSIYIFIYSLLLCVIIFWIYTGFERYFSEINEKSLEQEIKSYPNIDLNNFQGGNLNSN